MATYNDRLDAIIQACGGDCQSQLYGDKLAALALAIGKIDLMSPQELTELEKATARNNIGAGTGGGSIPEYELIDTVTISDSGITQLERSMTSGNIPYSFDEVMLLYKVPASTAGNSHTTVKAYVNASEFVALQISQFVLSGSGKVGFARFFNLGGYIYAEGIYNNNASLLGQYMQNVGNMGYQYINQKKFPIVKFNFLNDQGVGFPAGTEIKVYGVWHNAN